MVSVVEERKMEQSDQRPSRQSATRGMGTSGVYHKLATRALKQTYMQKCNAVLLYNNAKTLE